MALTADLTRTSYIAESGTQSLWDDDTVYGSPNVNRNQVAISLTAYKVDEDLVETALDIDAFDPETVTGFTTTNGDDGWHKYYFIIIDNWLIGTTYNQYDVVWSTSLNKWYQYINASSTSGHAVTETAYFTEATDPTAFIADAGTDEEPGNIVYQVINKVISYQSSICFNKAAALYAKQCCEDDCDDCDTRLGRLYNKIVTLYTNLAINETTGQYLLGEQNARVLENYCDDCGCSD